MTHEDDSEDWLTYIKGVYLSVEQLMCCFLLYESQHQSDYDTLLVFVFAHPSLLRLREYDVVECI